MCIVESWRNTVAESKTGDFGCLLPQNQFAGRVPEEYDGLIPRESEPRIHK
jgi:hypothetical protein